MDWRATYVCSHLSLSSASHFFCPAHPNRFWLRGLGRLRGWIVFREKLERKVGGMFDLGVERRTNEKQ